MQDDMTVSQFIIRLNHECVQAFQAGNVAKASDAAQLSHLVGEAQRSFSKASSDTKLPSREEVKTYIDKGVKDATEPSDEHKQAACLLAKFKADGRALTTGTMKHLFNSSLSSDEYRQIVDFLAIELRHNSPEWKNSLLFYLTGRGNACKYQ
jgi:hypothetical protein